MDPAPGGQEDIWAAESAPDRICVQVRTSLEMPFVLCNLPISEEIHDLVFRHHKIRIRDMFR